jgi:hypothetical protein
MASSQAWNLFILFIAILGALLFANFLLYLFDSPYRISIIMSLILTAIIVAIQFLVVR